VLFVHECHRVTGRHEDAFEAAYRDPGGWMDVLGRDKDARLLWYLHLTQGTGASYEVVTVTAVRDAEAWGLLAARMADGDLVRWTNRVDAMRHDVEAKILVPLPWSPLQDIDLAGVPATPGEQDHDPVLFLEDTAWPHQGKFPDYVAKAKTQYAEATLGREEALLELAAAFSPAFGTHRRREVVLWQRVRNPRGFMSLLTRGVPPERRAPGTWLHDALEVRDSWRSRLLRTARWSPLT